MSTFSLPQRPRSWANLCRIPSTMGALVLSLASAGCHEVSPSTTGEDASDPPGPLSECEAQRAAQGDPSCGRCEVSLDQLCEDEPHRCVTVRTDAVCTPYSPGEPYDVTNVSVGCGYVRWSRGGLGHWFVQVRDEASDELVYVGVIGEGETDEWCDTLLETGSLDDLCDEWTSAPPCEP